MERSTTPAGRVVLFFKNLLFVLVVPGTVAFYVPYRLLTSDGRFTLPVWGVAQAGAALVILVGAAILLRSIWEFATTGRGTPAPIDPPRVLVVQGLYRYVRNPMYVGVLLVIAGEALLFRASVLIQYAAVVCLLFHCFVIFYEEPTLRRTFGASYEAYCAAVRRWLPGKPYG